MIIIMNYVINLCREASEDQMGMREIVIEFNGI